MEAERCASGEAGREAQSSALSRARDAAADALCIVACLELLQGVGTDVQVSVLQMLELENFTLPSRRPVASVYALPAFTALLRSRHDLFVVSPAPWKKGHVVALLSCAAEPAPALCPTLTPQLRALESCYEAQLLAFLTDFKSSSIGTIGLLNKPPADLRISADTFVRQRPHIFHFKMHHPAVGNAIEVVQAHKAAATRAPVGLPAEAAPATRQSELFSTASPPTRKAIKHVPQCRNAAACTLLPHCRYAHPAPKPQTSAGSMPRELPSPSPPPPEASIRHAPLPYTPPLRTGGGDGGPYRFPAPPSPQMLPAPSSELVSTSESSLLRALWVVGALSECQEALSALSLRPADLLRLKPLAAQEKDSELQLLGFEDAALRARVRAALRDA